MEEAQAEIKEAEQALDEETYTPARIADNRCCMYPNFILHAIY
jgi:hypothetical protein